MSLMLWKQGHLIIFLFFLGRTIWPKDGHNLLQSNWHIGIKCYHFLLGHSNDHKKMHDDCKVTQNNYEETHNDHKEIQNGYKDT